ncbi:MAG: CDP-diacylglycerol--serine O-phosphatidyltransferase [Synergistaceae bacterium]|jgi:CDP-diacylglycerol--serine O-phosphatidyltransferase|nr:CDP-diacylglycerol--serine O-phosphatidyltransferase [Synergistaceae bacterium]
MRYRRGRRVRNIPFNKIVPNMITSGSVLCGMFSLILTYRRLFLPSALVLVMAVFFDYMDGKLARRLGGSSAFGEELDSLADALSFGAAPAFLIYARYADMDGGGMPGALGAAFFALCGVLRLARFNVAHVAGSFQGLPIPAGGMALAALVIGDIPLTPALAVAAMVSLGVLMISSVPYGNLKLLRKGNVHKRKALTLALIVISCFALLREKSLLALAGTYIASGLLGIDWGMWLSKHRNDEDEKHAREKD